ncbi:MAG: thiamine-phosphate kinase [Burkholderiales bacterium]|nr:thiamine-phosphate kinase [Burkholderiales bacterium]
MSRPAQPNSARAGRGRTRGSHSRDDTGLPRQGRAPTGEFDLIRRHFTRAPRRVALGVGDDCALLQPRPGLQYAVSTDLLLEGTHFFAGADPVLLGHKSLAVNLSDLAAMGADPLCALLAISLPRADEGWIQAFTSGFFALAERFGVDLAGGDTTAGPLAICVTVIGEVPGGLALRRDGARAGDDVWISGQTGEAALEVARREGRIQIPPAWAACCAARLDAPEPRVELGGRLRGIAHGMIDVSDGLLADLGHVAQASRVDMEISLEALPQAQALRACADAALALQCIATGGDDYELAFTAPGSARGELDALCVELGLALTRIGACKPGSGTVSLLDARGQTVSLPQRGYEHFAG